MPDQGLLQGYTPIAQVRLFQVYWTEEGCLCTSLVFSSYHFDDGGCIGWYQLYRAEERTQRMRERCTPHERLFDMSVCFLSSYPVWLIFFKRFTGLNRKMFSYWRMMARLRLYPLAKKCWMPCIGLLKAHIRTTPSSSTVCPPFHPPCISSQALLQTRDMEHKSPTTLGVNSMATTKVRFYFFIGSWSDPKASTYATFSDLPG